jgi:hypothetical protein
MPQWNHPPQPKVVTTREQSAIDRLHHFVDGGGNLDPDARPIVADGLKLILELIENRRKRTEFLEMYDPHED